MGKLVLLALGRMAWLACSSELCWVKGTVEQELGTSVACPKRSGTLLVLTSRAEGARKVFY